MSEVSLWRLYLLRGMYLLLAVGLALMVWPSIIAPPDSIANAKTVIRSLLGALALLSVLGLRYPLKMLPLLLFELLWKVIWVVAFALRMWLAGGWMTTRLRHCLRASWALFWFSSSCLGATSSGTISRPQLTLGARRAPLD